MVKLARTACSTYIYVTPTIEEFKIWTYNFRPLNILPLPTLNLKHSLYSNCQFIHIFFFTMTMMWPVSLITFCCGFCLGLKFLIQNPWIFVYFTGSFLLNSEVAPDGTSLSLPYAVLRGEASLTINVLVPVPVFISSFLGPKAPALRVAISGPKKSLDFQGPPLPMARVMDLLELKSLSFCAL